jgi:fructose-bisphosphate aldolase class II
MTLARTAGLISDAVARGRAVAAFNVITVEHAEAIAAGAARVGVGAILQVSENAVRFHGGNPRPLLLACRAIAEAAPVPLSLHLDHVEDLELAGIAIVEAQSLGISSLMIDASRLDYAANLAVTANIAERARGVGLWVEAELGAIGGKDGAHAPGVRTDPVEAAGFVASTGVDGLAVAVGSSHAMHDRGAVIDDDLVRRIASAVLVPLVLHGSSGVSDELIDRAVAAGIRKVNVGTALNLAGVAAIRESLSAVPDLVDPRAFLRPSRDAMADVVAAFCALVA